MSIVDSVEQLDHALTAAELAALLNVHRLTIYRHIKAGKLKAFYVGAALRLEPRAVAAWLREWGCM